jgi:hypothetical protein
MTAGDVVDTCGPRVKSSATEGLVQLRLDAINSPATRKGNPTAANPFAPKRLLFTFSPALLLFIFVSSFVDV